MSETTNIEWATSTGNPWIGCTKVSPGCKNCYAAELDDKRFSKTMGGGKPGKPESHWGKGAPRVRTKAFWKDALKWDREFAAWRDQPCAPQFRPVVEEHAKRIRPRIFPSLCDWLDDEVPIEWLADFLKLIHDTPNLDWLLLTKRPENCQQRIWAAIFDLEERSNHPCGSIASEWLRRWMDAEGIPSRVWLGVSVEDQQRADERIPLLLQIPAKVRFLSVEPLLEKVDLDDEWLSCKVGTNSGIHWVIIGGESGANRRDCGVEAIVDVAEQCVAAGVQCFVKQDCAFKPGQQGRIPDHIWALKQFPNL